MQQLDDRQIYLYRVYGGLYSSMLGPTTHMPVWGTMSERISPLMFGCVSLYIPVNGDVGKVYWMSNGMGPECDGWAWHWPSTETWVREVGDLELAAAADIESALEAAGKGAT